MPRNEFDRIRRRLGIEEIPLSSARPFSLRGEFDHACTMTERLLPPFVPRDATTHKIVKAAAVTFLVTLPVPLPVGEAVASTAVARGLYLSLRKSGLDAYNHLPHFFPFR